MAKVPINLHPIPYSITVSRKTGEITHVEYAMPTERQYLYFCKTLLQLYELDEVADLIPVGGIPNFHPMEISDDDEISEDEEI